MQAATISAEQFTTATLDDPYPLFAKLRASAPVHLVADRGLYLAVTHDAIRSVLRDPATFSSNLVAVLEMDSGDGVRMAETGGVDVLATADPPVHSGQRGLVRKQFDRRSVQSLEEVIDRALAPRIAQLVSDGGGDWMAEIASVVPVLVIGHVLGLPDSDAEALRTWSDVAVELLSGLAAEDRRNAIIATITEFMIYLGDQIDRAQAEPTGGLLDVIAGAVHAGDLTPDHAVVLLVQLVTAGAESTSSLIGTAVRLLVSDPDVQRTMREDPERVPSLVEEAVRLESPFQCHFRVTTQPTTLCGFDLPAGARIMLMWGAANRDSSVFDHPDELDLERDNPNAHNSFGHGIHFCIGAHLARSEAVLATRRLLEATSHLEFATEAPATYLPSLFVRRLARLPIRCHRSGE